MWYVYIHTYTLHFHHCFEHLYFSSENNTSYIKSGPVKKKLKAQEYYTCFITETYSPRRQVQSKLGIPLIARDLLSCRLSQRNSAKSS